MVFKRRDNRPVLRIFQELLYPRGGWSRAIQYVKHRVNRLPDPPERIARGIFAGVFTTFTPFFGLHFIVAFLIAKLVRGNVIAALLATFFGNPLTFVPITVVSLRLGHWILGSDLDREMDHSVMRSFFKASDDLWDNLLSLFTSRHAHWDRLFDFYEHVFFPYMVGGVIPGIIAGGIAYLLSVPVIRAYQNRRIKRLRARVKKHRKAAHDLADATRKSD